MSCPPSQFPYLRGMLSLAVFRTVSISTKNQDLLHAGSATRRKARARLKSWNQDVGLFREWGEGLDTQPEHT
jgi:hypothetical protein